MGTNTILQIRALIRSAQKAEQETMALQTTVSEVLPTLHRRIQLPITNKEKAFIDFLTHYIETVPNLLETLADIAHEAKIQDLVQPLVSVAENHFLRKASISSPSMGLHALVCRAYLAHRLVEELNEEIILSCGAPLINGNMAGYNLIVHAFLGEQFANKLDLAANFSVQALVPRDTLAIHTSLRSYVRRHKLYGLNDALKMRPKFTMDGKVALSFGEHTNTQALH